MTTAREWVRRGGWTDGQPWHLRPVPPPSRRPGSTTAGCGLWFSSGDVVAVWGGEERLPPANLCVVCEAASEALQAIEARPSQAS